MGSASEQSVTRSASRPHQLFAVDAAQKLVRLRAAIQGRRPNADAAVLILHGYHTCFPEADGHEVPATRLRMTVKGSAVAAVLYR